MSDKLYNVNLNNRYTLFFDFVKLGVWWLYNLLLQSLVYRNVWLCRKYFIIHQMYGYRCLEYDIYLNNVHFFLLEYMGVIINIAAVLSEEIVGIWWKKDLFYIKSMYNIGFIYQIQTCKYIGCNFKKVCSDKFKLFPNT